MINKTKIKDDVNTMLDCLLNMDLDCKNCKNCEKVDACCFLSEAVFVSNAKEMKKKVLAP